MNNYEERIAAKKARLEERAAKKRQEAAERYQTASNLADGIPFGQPILVGHHSEKSDRKRRANITKNMDKSVELTRYAASLEQRANRVGKGGISSDDPEAITKLQERVDKLKANQDLMKKVNAVIRKTKNKPEEEQIKAILEVSDRISTDDAKSLITPKYGTTGFPSYALSNNNANIKRLEKRIATISQTRDLPLIEEKYEEFSYKECPEENRVMFIFDGKPSEEIRTILKKHAFKWSPTRKAWVRHLNNAGIYAAKNVKGLLESL